MCLVKRTKDKGKTSNAVASGSLETYVAHSANNLYKNIDCSFAERHGHSLNGHRGLAILRESFSISVSIQ